MYVEVYVDESELLEDLSDDQLKEEMERRGIEASGISFDQCRVLGEMLRYRKPEVVLEHLDKLLFPR